MQNISPELLKLILAGQTVDGYGLGNGNQIWDPTLSAENQTPNYEKVIYKNIKDPSFGGTQWGTWNTDGTFRGTGTGDSDNLALTKFIAGALGMYGAGSALAGAGGAGSGAVSGMDMMADNPSWWSQVGNISAGDAAGAAGGLSSADKSALYGNTGYTGDPSGAGAMSGAQTGAYDAGLKAAGGAAGSAGSGSAGGLLGDAAKAIGGNGNLIGAGLGAVAGALDGGDKTQSSSRDPWGPSQDFLKQLIGQGSQLSTQYQQQPFSQAQQTAYGNVGGLLDSINKNAGGLIGGFSANASGQNQFDRNNPNKQLIGSQFNLNGFAPGLLGYLGSK